MTTVEHRLPALELRQGKDRLLYAFAVDGKLLPSFATISRLCRDDENTLFGYQRPEVGTHITEIRKYLESESPLLPNALVVAFSPDTLRFESATEGEAVSRAGTVVIPCDPDSPTWQKPGWVVDGQQRLAAIRDAAIESFPVWVVAFVASNEKEQRDQFILVNNTKPLPKGLIYELLPITEGHLPSALQRRRFPTAVVQRLNLDENSPLRGKIRTPTVPDGVVADTSMIKMVENSLSDGILYRLRVTEQDASIDAMLQVLRHYWQAVAETFPRAWGLPPRKSRLMHGAGILSMGFIMDAIADRYHETPIPSVQQFRNDLDGLKEVCRWTDGYWDFGPGVQRKWNELQNIPKDIQMLANYLLVHYKTHVWK